MGRFRACYEAGLAENPTLAGRVSVDFVIGKDGLVAAARDGASELGDEGLFGARSESVRACIVRAFSALEFPSAACTIRVTYPLALDPA